MPAEKTTNQEIANVLDQIADLLEAQDANIHRVRAYRNGANSVREAQDDLAGIVLEGKEAELQEIPGIGEGLGRVIATYVTTGRSNLLDRLKGEVDPDEIFTRVPGIGQTLAQRISHETDIDSLEELERAAHDGRLAEIEGFGEERVNAVRVSLAGMLSPAGQSRARQRVSMDEVPKRERPDIATLLDVDAEYRRKAQEGELRKIAPRRFNPENKAWLPILNTQRGKWEFTALYSNTARAHKLGTTHDWVVIYFEQYSQEDQVTVVTENSGPLQGERVVRGHEAETLRYYQNKDK